MEITYHTAMDSSDYRARPSSGNAFCALGLREVVMTTGAQPSPGPIKR